MVFAIFPPVMSNSIEIQLRQRLSDLKVSGTTPTEIARLAGIQQSSLSLFMRGIRGLSLKTTDRLMFALDRLESETPNGKD